MGTSNAYEASRIRRVHRGPAMCRDPCGVEVHRSHPIDFGVLSSKRFPAHSANLLNRELKPAAKALKLTGVNWHWFRHAHATMLDSTGAPIGTTQALFGHSSSDITRGTYIHSVPADARRAVEGVEKPLETGGKLIGPKTGNVRKWGLR